MNYIELLRRTNIKNHKDVGSVLNEKKDIYRIGDESMLFFISNCFIESSGFNKFKESLYYTTEQRLRDIYPSAFKQKYNAKDYLRNTEKLANLVYDDRLFPFKKLGNTRDGDGFKYIGRGAIQITGRYNYTKLSKVLDIDLVNNPSLLESIGMAVEVSMVWWQENGLNDCKTLLETRQRVTGVRSSNPPGFKECLSYYIKLKEEADKLK